jgi:hypothetical protein
MVIILVILFLSHLPFFMLGFLGFFLMTFLSPNYLRKLFFLRWSLGFFTGIVFFIMSFYILIKSGVEEDTLGTILFCGVTHYFKWSLLALIIDMVLSVIYILLWITKQQEKFEYDIDPKLL